MCGYKKRENKMKPNINDIPKSLTHYLDMWNEHNIDSIRKHLDLAITDDCLWVDPQHNHIGKQALEDNVRKFRTKFPQAILAINSTIDGHNNRYRYEWIISSNGKIMIYGFDVVTVNSAGLIERVDGFFGKLDKIK